MTLSPERVAGVIHRQRREAARDPIARHRFSSPQARELVLDVCRGVEGYIRSGSRAGKSVAGALLAVAFARGVRRIDARTIHEDRAGAPERWIDLPALPTANTGLIAVEAYKQAEGSTIATFRRLLGSHPHRVIREGSYTTGFRVKPDACRSDDPADWSRISVFPRDGASAAGIPAHWVWADEPPSAAMWGELRVRIDAGERLYRWITATPIKRSEWEWLRVDYAVPASWKREIVLSVFDNQALSSEDKEALRAAAEADPEGLTDARLYGAYVDTAGENPFRVYAPTLREWAENTREPRESEVPVMGEVDDLETGRQTELMRLKLFEWWKPEKGERYYVICDPSLGVDDPEHDPCGLLVIARVRPRVVARYNGFCGGYALGSLAAAVAERYNDALVDVDMTGGYGDPVLTAMGRYQSHRHPHGYGNINRDRQVDHRGKYRNVLGFTITGEGKADIIEAVRLELAKARAGQPFCYVPSIGVVRCLQEASMDGNGKLLKPRGTHYEDLICYGRALHLMQTRGKARREEAGERGPRLIMPKVAGRGW